MMNELYPVFSSTRFDFDERLRMDRWNKAWQKAANNYIVAKTSLGYSVVPNTPHNTKHRIFSAQVNLEKFSFSGPNHTPLPREHLTKELERYNRTRITWHSSDNFKRTLAAYLAGEGKLQ